MQDIETSEEHELSSDMESEHLPSEQGRFGCNSLVLLGVPFPDCHKEQGSFGEDHREDVDGPPDLVRRIFLDEVGLRDGHLGLCWPRAGGGKIRAAGEERTGAIPSHRMLAYAVTFGNARDVRRKTPSRQWQGLRRRW